MRRTILWKDQAKADLRAIDQPTALRILHSLARLVATGEGYVKRLQAVTPEEFRLGVGDRLRFHHQGDAVTVTSVKHRRESYR